jgi:ribulose kinase
VGFFISFRKSSLNVNSLDANVKMRGRVSVVRRGMLAPRKLLQKRKKAEVFRDAADEADQKNWRRLMTEIEETGSAVSVLKRERAGKLAISRDVVIGTLVRLKQLKKWNLVSEVYFFLLF